MNDFKASLWSSSSLIRCVRLKRLSVLTTTKMNLSFSLCLSVSLTLAKSLLKTRRREKEPKLSLERRFFAFVLLKPCVFYAREFSRSIMIWREMSSLFFGAKTAGVGWKRLSIRGLLLSVAKKVYKNECCDLFLSLSGKRARARRNTRNTHF